MDKKRVLICGASGFIGRNIAEELSKDGRYTVTGTYLSSEPFNNPNINLVKIDLRDAVQVGRIVKDQDIIIQAAATTSGAKDIIARPYIHVTDNALINSLLFRAAYENKLSHVLFFSCTVMYQSSQRPLKETDFDPAKDICSQYFGVGWTKVYLEKMSEFYSRIGETKYTVIRHSNIYGPYDKFDLDKSHVFGATVTKVLSAPVGGKLTVWGSGEEERDLLYVSDLVNFVRLAIEKQEEKFAIFNAGLGKSISIKDLVTKIIDISGKRIDLEFDTSKPTIKTKLCLDSSKARTALGWQPQVSLEEGIKLTLDWRKNQISGVKKI